MMFLLLTALALSPPANPPGAPSLQQQFDGATAAVDQGRWEAAATGFAALESRMATKSPATLAVVRIRRGIALSNLSRADEAEAELIKGLGTLPKNDATLAEDRFDGWLTLGKLRETALDYAEAAGDYQTALLAAPDDDGRISSLADFARVTMFTDSAAAVAAVDKALTLRLARPAPDKAALAQYRTLRGRALLNGGKYGAALGELGKAVEELGGLTDKVDYADIAARSDYAIAALRAGRPEDAKKYLTYTGAGHLQEGDLSRGIDADPPVCGGPDEIAPDDVAVVEFGIGDDGSVMHAAPVYASRQGPIAVAFARAVAGWSWSPDAVAKMKPFFRRSVRLELRCLKTGERPGIGELLSPEVDAWYAAHGIRPAPDAPTLVRRIELARAELARSEATDGPASPKLLPLLARLGDTSLVPQSERASFIARATTIAAAAKAPPALLARLRIAALDAELESFPRGWSKTREERIEEIIADPQIAADHRTVAALRLLAVDTLTGAKARERASALAEAAAADDRLSAEDPLKVGANLRLASLRLAAGDLAGARAAYERTRLSAQECALVDARPAIRRSGLGSDDFPMEAMVWQFEGWVRTEFDITSAGHTANIRAIVAYPPFVFDDATTKGLSRALFEQSYRPEGGLGCGGTQRTVRYFMTQ